MNTNIDATCEIQPTSSECELIQARTATQYYIQYGLDLLLIILVVAILAKVMVWRNWVSEIITK